MKKSLLIGLLGLGVLFTGCAKNEVKPVTCSVNQYFDAKENMCKDALVKISGIVKEFKGTKVVVSLEDNTIVEIEKGDKNYKIGEEINIFVKK